MQNEIAFSIITPVYNCEQYIAETISSVLKHVSKFNFEYIIINDGSKDNTIKLLTENPNLYQKLIDLKEN